MYAGTEAGRNEFSKAAEPLAELGPGPRKPAPAAQTTQSRFISKLTRSWDLGKIFSHYVLGQVQADMYQESKLYVVSSYL